MENRYDKKLKKGNQLIINLTPANGTLRLILALEIQRYFAKNNSAKILEIGCGEGDSTLAVLKLNEDLKMDALDVSEDMIKEAKKYLGGYGDNVNFICDDALNFLGKTEKRFDIITASWTIHNFTWPEKIKILKAIYGNLNPGGRMMLMDKIFPDDEKTGKQMLQSQLERYNYLDEEIKKAILAHDNQDYLPEYRMDETAFKKELERIGFKNIQIADRVEMSVVLTAQK